MSAEQKKVNVSVLGKGEQEVNVDGKTTVGELKNLLALDSDVTAETETGELTDEQVVDGDIKFTPNVEGGGYHE